MKQLTFTILVMATMLLSAFTTMESIDWEIGEAYSIEFKSSEVEGIFKTFAGDISFDENNLSDSKFNVSVDVASINTGNGMKNKHAKSDKWLDVAKYPTITFSSSKFSKSNEGYEVEGTLKMHGVKKQVTIPFTFNGKIFKGNFAVNRMDYGVGTMEGMSKKVPNKIAITFSVPVTKK